MSLYRVDVTMFVIVDAENQQDARTSVLDALESLDPTYLEFESDEVAPQ